VTTTPKVALSIAGSDPSGGAGVQADLKTFAALGVYGAAAVTALTAQNTREVRAVHVPPAGFVAAQVDLVFEDLEVAATKTGMLATADIVVAVAHSLASHRARNLVVDPVMVAKSGARLLDESAVEAVKRALLPLAAVVTPNIPEAAVLLGMAEGEVLGAPDAACRGLLALGPRAVLLKGGHAGGDASDDLYFDGRDFTRLAAPRIATENTHGTGCTLSAAIAARLALGDDPLAAVRAAKRYVSAAIEAAKEWKLGRGHGPVDHFFASRHD
jgi:hydroxymethylpyrimidine/phosphomethylpyrimidine kinase